MRVTFNCLFPDLNSSLWAVIVSLRKSFRAVPKMMKAENPVLEFEDDSLRGGECSILQIFLKFGTKGFISAS